MDELDAGLKPKTRRKIELAIEGGWKFDKETWDASVARHKKYDMAKIFSDFDSDGDGKASFPLPPHSAPLCCSSDGCSLHCCSSSHSQLLSLLSPSTLTTRINSSFRSPPQMTLREFMRAFRALGLPKRDGGKMAVDEAMFKSFDTVCTGSDRSVGSSPVACSHRVAPKAPTSHHLLAKALSWL